MLGLTIGALLAGCATTLEGAAETPSSWMGTPSSSCTNVAGSYSTHGEPAEANAHSGLYNVFWPTAGSLIAMIETGANRGDRFGMATLDLAIDSAGRPVFAVPDASGKTTGLASREWQCTEGVLETRALLSGGLRASEFGLVDESVIRLWKASDGALIAENTVESARMHASGPTTDRRALARFYFRFAPASPVAKTR